MPDHAYIYILSSTYKRLYIDVTTQLEHRIAQHKSHEDPNSFTARYRIDCLVYTERFATITTAIAREKQLKRWSRIKKLNLIITHNPTWQDLSADWAKLIPLYREPNP